MTLNRRITLTSFLMTLLTLWYFWNFCASWLRVDNLLFGKQSLIFMFTLLSTLHFRALFWALNIWRDFTFSNFHKPLDCVCSTDFIPGDPWLIIMLWCRKFSEKFLCFLLWSWLAFLLWSWVTLLFLTINCGWLGFLSISWLFFKRISWTAYNKGNKQKFKNARKIKDPNSIGRK